MKGSAAIYIREIFRHSLAQERRRRVHQAVIEAAVDRPGLAWSLLNTRLATARALQQCFKITTLTLQVLLLESC